MKFGIIVFPGSNCDHDAYHVLDKVVHQPVEFIWHESSDVSSLDAIIVPGGFSYGDYLRTGALACFSPVMKAVERFARSGGLVLGICNGFQILVECGMLPGALMANRGSRFICRFVHVRVENAETPFTRACAPEQVLELPIAHMAGSYFSEEEMLIELERNNQVVFRYCDPQGRLSAKANPNGSVEAIAGVVNREGNVLGMMPHPERAGEAVLASTDGLFVFQSMLSAVFGRTGVL